MIEQEGKGTTARPGPRHFLLLCAFFAVWLVANAPALSGAWWYLDDYVYVMQPDAAALLRSALSRGRPVEALCHLSFLLDPCPDGATANVILRIVQGSLHALAATLIARWLVRESGTQAAALAALPFLLWPFGAEATLWRTALSYPLSAVIAMVALEALSRRRTLRARATGGALVVIAMWAHPVPAFLTAAMWMLRPAVDLLRKRALDVRALKIEGAFLLGGYVVGGAASILIAQAIGDAAAARSALGFAPIEKLKLFGQLIANVIAFDLYPKIVVGLHVALLAFAALALTIRSRLVGARRAVAAAALVAFAGLVAPFLAVLPVTESWPAWRVTYLGPLVFGTALVVVEVTAGAPWVRWVGRLLVAAIAIAYVPVARAVADDYRTMFLGDARIVAKAEALCDELGLTSICAPGYPDVPVYEWNPFGVRYLRCDSIVSALFYAESAPWCIRALGSTPVSVDEDVIRAATELSLRTEATGFFQLLRLPGEPVLVLCQP